MRLDKVLLQSVVDKMATEKNPDGTWKLNEAFSKEFYELAYPYVRTAANKSDRYDPEDACSQVMLDLWLALKKYGPRPQGIPFVNYTLKLKTRNTLTNRANRRFSDKCCMNFIPKVSLSSIKDIDLYGNKRAGRTGAIMDCSEMSGEVAQYYDRSKKDRKKTKKSAETLYNIDSIEIDVVEQHIVDDLRKLRVENYELKVENETLRKEIAELKKAALVNEKPVEKEKEMTELLKIGDGEIGRKYITKLDKIIQLLGVTEEHAEILVFATNKSIHVPLTYEVKQYGNGDAVKEFGASVKEIVDIPLEKKISTKEVVQEEEPIEPEVSTNLRVTAEDVGDEKEPAIVAASEPKPVKKGRKQMKKHAEKTEKAAEVVVEEKKETPVVEQEKTHAMRDGSKKAFVLGLLQKGECSRDSLVAAVRKEFPSDKTEAQSANYVSVILANLKKTDKINIVSAGRGKYRIE